ncbi:MAG: histone [Candidatus Nanohaloarchaea archaeon]|nr:histone [Candidatus Nanohaloarchaea archaeon]
MSEGRKAKRSRIMEISRKTINRLLKDAGAEEISEGAFQEFAEVIELYAGYITEEALEVSRENNHKSLKKEDIQKALE